MPGGGSVSPAQKIEHLIGMDRCYEILSWPLDELDPVRRSMRMQVLRVIMPIASKRCSMASSAAKLPASATGSVFSQSSRATCAQQIVARRHVRGGPWGMGRGSKLRRAVSKTAHDFWESAAA
jgi:hypothetical protein